MRTRLSHALLAAACALPLLSGCVQMPTEKQSVVDLRPQLSFRIADDAHLPARVIVDGQDMGAVGEFRDGVAALRLLPGAHAMRVELNGARLLDESVYLGDGVNRTFLIK